MRVQVYVYILLSDKQRKSQKTVIYNYLHNIYVVMP